MSVHPALPLSLPRPSQLHVLRDRSGYEVVSDEDTCCPGVVDPLTLLTILAAIAGAVLGLRQVAIDNLPKRKRALEAPLIFAGKRPALLIVISLLIPKSLDRAITGSNLEGSKFLEKVHHLLL